MTKICANGVFCLPELNGRHLFFGGRAFTQRRKIWAWRPRLTSTQRFDGISLISTINGVVNNSKESHLPVHHWASLRRVMALTHPQCSMVHSAAPKSTRARAFLPQRANNICPKAKRQPSRTSETYPKNVTWTHFPKNISKDKSKTQKASRKNISFFHSQHDIHQTITTFARLLHPIHSGVATRGSLYRAIFTPKRIWGGRGTPQFSSWFSIIPLAADRLWAPLTIETSWHIYPQIQQWHAKHNTST